MASTTGTETAEKERIKYQMTRPCATKTTAQGTVCLPEIHSNVGNVGNVANVANVANDGNVELRGMGSG